MARMTDPWSAQQQCHLAYISEFSTDIQHVVGKNNTVADALSRTVQVVEAEGIDYAAMAIDQQSDNDLQNLQTSTGLRLKKILFNSATTIWCDILTGTPYPVVLPGWRRSVFNVVHNLSHPGVQMTHTMVTNKFVWRIMNKQVTEWARSCIPCQQMKIAHHMRATLQHFEVLQRHFDSIHIDFIEPLPPSQGFLYLLSIVDRFTRWPEAIPLTDTAPSLAPGRCCFIGSHVSAFRQISLWIGEPS